MNTVFIPCRIKGVDNVEMPEDSLEKRTGFHEDESHTADWVEYWLDGELVHRSAHVHLKHGLGSLSAQGQFN